MMKRIVVLGLVVLSVFSFQFSVLQAQTVSNVVARQVENTVEITYDLDKAAAVLLLFSRDGGDTYSATPKAVTGAVGITPAGQHKQIVWNLLADAPDWDVERARFKVVAVIPEKLTFSVNGASFNMVYVAGGKFTMGGTDEQRMYAEPDEKPTRKVNISDFYIAETEVTQLLWFAVMRTTVRQQRDKGDPNWSISGEGANFPMYYISWNECQEFVRKLNKLLEDQLEGRHFAIPTEAQWEYAARGGKKQGPYPYMYAGSDILGSVAWFKDNSTSPRGVQPVGGKAANSLGIYDMSGNVAEWCRDWYGTYDVSVVNDPTGPMNGTQRVYRGGSWYQEARYCRVSERANRAPYDRNATLGLRLVLEQ